MKDKDDIMNLLHDLDDEAVEEIAERYPLLDDEDQDRLVSLCLKKTDGAGSSDEERTGELSVSGTEQYRRPHWYKFAASAAAVVLAAVGITGIAAMNRTVNRFKDSNLPGAPGEPDEISVSTVLVTDSYSGGKKSEEEATKAVRPVTTTSTVTTTVTTSSSTVTESLTTTVTTTTEEIVSTTTTEELPTDAVTTADDVFTPEVTTTAVDVRAPIGSWTSGNDNSRKTWHFFSDGNDGRFILDEMGIGISFDYEISGDSITFHMGGDDAETPARIEWLTDNSFVIYWKETGAEELLMALPDTYSSNDNE